MCGFVVYTTGRFVFSSRALCPRVSSFLLALWAPRWGKRELICVLLVHLFVCFVRAMLVVVIFLFLLVSGVGCGLWLWHSLVFFINFFSSHVWLIHVRQDKYDVLKVNFNIEHWASYTRLRIQRYLLQTPVGELDRNFVWLVFCKTTFGAWCLKTRDESIATESKRAQLWHNWMKK